MLATSTNDPQSVSRETLYIHDYIWAEVIFNKKYYMLCILTFNQSNYICYFMLPKIYIRITILIILYRCISLLLINLIYIKNSYLKFC